ncbi:MAG: hypothetical protein AUK44_02085 [Porphyromonadaceae bacterium CG2_30_38_12]|nr:MAG: hypothetical protein AUK44_02085 [Porphyromonadaceae bacterium CG2_30_38_12]
MPIQLMINAMLNRNAYHKSGNHINLKNALLKILDDLDISKNKNSSENNSYKQSIHTKAQYTSNKADDNKQVKAEKPDKKQ